MPSKKILDANQRLVDFRTIQPTMADRCGMDIGSIMGLLNNFSKIVFKVLVLDRTEMGEIAVSNGQSKSNKMLVTWSIPNDIHTIMEALNIERFSKKMKSHV